MSTPALLRLENRRQQGVELPHHLTRGKATGFDGVECIQQTSGMVLQSGRLMNGGVEFTARLRCDIHCRIGVTVRDFTEGGDDRGTVPSVSDVCCSQGIILGIGPGLSTTTTGRQEPTTLAGVQPIVGSLTDPLPHGIVHALPVAGDGEGLNHLKFHGGAFA